MRMSMPELEKKLLKASRYFNKITPVPTPREDGELLVLHSNKHGSIAVKFFLLETEMPKTRTPERPEPYGVEGLVMVVTGSFESVFYYLGDTPLNDNEFHEIASTPWSRIDPSEEGQEFILTRLLESLRLKDSSEESFKDALVSNYARFRTEQRRRPSTLPKSHPLAQSALKIVRESMGGIQ
jgi:hypothetical protein